MKFSDKLPTAIDLLVMNLKYIPKMVVLIGLIPYLFNKAKFKITEVLAMTTNKKIDKLSPILK